MIHVLHIIANNSSVPYFNWLAALAKKETDVQFSFAMLYDQEPALKAEMQPYGFEVYQVPFNPAKRGSSMLRAVFKLYRLMRKLKPDVVHTHLFDDSLPALFAAKLAGIPVRVATKQDTAFHWYYAPKGVKYDRRINRLATHLVAVSEECREFILEKENADPAKVHLVHHGIPVAELSHQTEEAKKRLREKYNPEGNFLVGTVARLIDWKGHRYILEAATTLVPEFPDLCFLFAGEGNLKAELEATIRKNKLEKHVRFSGWVNRSDIPSLYGIMDIYLHPAFMEPFGFVLAEAMVNGTPVISTPTGAARDAIVNGENGLLVEYKNAEAIVEAIRFIRSKTEAERKQLGERGRETALKLFPVEKMWQGYLSIYRNALKNRHHG